MIDWSRATVFTTTEFDVARDLLDLGHTPPVLEVLAQGLTDVERARVVREALGTLAARGWFAESRFDAAFAEDMRTVLHAEFQHDLVVAPPRAQRALVGHRAGRAVLVTRIDDQVALVRIRPQEAATALVGLLGPVTPGLGPTARIPADVLAGASDAAGGDPELLVPHLLRGGCSGADADLVHRMCAVEGIAQLGAGRPGGRRAPGVLLVHATPHGCFHQLRPTPDVLCGPLPEDATVQVGPADGPFLVGELERLADAVPAQPSPVSPGGSGTGVAS